MKREIEDEGNGEESDNFAVNEASVTDIQGVSNEQSLKGEILDDEVKIEEEAGLGSVPEGITNVDGGECSHDVSAFV